jgi:hypothetical protein
MERSAIRELILPSTNLSRIYMPKSRITLTLHPGYERSRISPTLHPGYQ